jgi:hypothetical protein
MGDPGFGEIALLFKSAAFVYPDSLDYFPIPWYFFLVCHTRGLGKKEEGRQRRP